MLSSQAWGRHDEKHFFLLVFATASPLACGKSEQPAILPPAQDMTRQAEPPPPAEAPVTSAAAAWSARVAQGTNSHHASALHGKNAMPAKGGNPSLADADVTAAVDFMVAQSR